MPFYLNIIFVSYLYDSYFLLDTIREFTFRSFGFILLGSVSQLLFLRLQVGYLLDLVSVNSYDLRIRVSLTSRENAICDWCLRDGL